MYKEEYARFRERRDYCEEQLYQLCYEGVGYRDTNNKDLYEVPLEWDSWYQIVSDSYYIAVFQRLVLLRRVVLFYVFTRFNIFSQRQRRVTAFSFRYAHIALEQEQTYQWVGDRNGCLFFAEGMNKYSASVRGGAAAIL